MSNIVRSLRVDRSDGYARGVTITIASVESHRVAASGLLDILNKDITGVHRAFDRDRTLGDRVEDVGLGLTGANHRVSLAVGEDTHGHHIEIVLGTERGDDVSHGDQGLVERSTREVPAIRKIGVSAIAVALTDVVENLHRLVEVVLLEAKK